MRALSKAEWLIDYGAGGNVSKAADALEAQAEEIGRLKRELLQVPAWRSGMTKRAEAAEGRGCQA